MTAEGIKPTSDPAERTMADLYADDAALQNRSLADLYSDSDAADVEREVDASTKAEKVTASELSPEDLAGLEVIRRVSPVLDDILIEQWEDEEADTATRPRDSYTAEDEKELSEENRLMLAKDRARIAEMKPTWKHNETKEFGDFVEKLVLVCASRLRWFGRETEVKPTEESDDIIRATDIAVFFHTRDTEQVVGMDLTDSAIFGLQKVANSMRFINNGRLSTLLFSFDGTDENVPHFINVVSRKRAIELASLMENALNTGNWDLVAAHPLQIEILAQMAVQAEAYLDYAQHIDADEKSVVQKIGNRIIHNSKKREVVLEELQYAKEVCSQALQKRMAVLNDLQNTGSEEVRAMLEAHVPDPEHVQFAKLFNRSGLAQYRRFKAFLTVMPPRRRDEATSKKLPIEVGERDDKNKERLRARFGSLVGLGPDEIRQLEGEGKGAESAE